MKKGIRIGMLFLFIFFWFNSINAQDNFLFNRKNKQLQTMSQRWELQDSLKNGTFILSPYKPIYILPVRWSSLPNEDPYSGNGKPEYVAPPGTNYNNIEAKFQISFKTKIIQNIFWNNADLWVAYTQSANWQIYNNSLSRPFREMNYEPEVILNVPLHFKVLGFDARMFGVAFNHQSNGKSLPFSRSWNRIIFHAGFESGNWTVLIRPWLRLRASKDDNPDIAKYIGNGDLTVTYSYGSNVFSFIGTNNLDFDKTLRGNANVSWSRTLQGNLRGYLQVTHGFGDTLIDYNNVQTTVGIGVSLVDWL